MDSIIWEKNLRLLNTILPPPSFYRTLCTHRNVFHSCNLSRDARLSVQTFIDLKGGSPDIHGFYFNEVALKWKLFALHTLSVPFNLALSSNVNIKIGFSKNWNSLVKCFDSPIFVFPSKHCTYNKYTHYIGNIGIWMLVIKQIYSPHYRRETGQGLVPSFNGIRILVACGIAVGLNLKICLRTGLSKLAAVCRPHWMINCPLIRVLFWKRNT